jgi:hypothetical protein
MALTFMYSNFARPHMTLNKERGEKTTPAMAAGVVNPFGPSKMLVVLISN